MSTTFEGFSEYEVKQSKVKFGDSDAIGLGCVGKLTQTLNAKTVTKKCEGIETISRTYGDGTGELAFTLHMKLAAYYEMFGLQTEGFKAGVRAYGQKSKHKEFCYTAIVYDEDRNIKYIAYPRCVIKTGISKSTENGAEEVAEIEVTASVMPDELGNAMYEAFAEELDATTAEQWLNNFSNTLIAADNTYAINMTVSPAASAKVKIIDAKGDSVGTCVVNAKTGAVNVPPVMKGTYTYTVYADGYKPNAGTITVTTEDVTVEAVTLTK